MAPPGFKRPGPHDDRDHQRPKTNPHGVPAIFEGEDATGNYEGPELHAIRARRPTPLRIAHLERRVDDHGLKLAGVDSKLDTLVDLAGAERDARQARAIEDERRAALRGKWIIALITAVGVAVAAIVAAAVH